MVVTRHRGLTRIELLTIISVLVFLVALLLPAVQAARGASRTVTCVDNLQQIGIALQNYENLQKVFPAGCEAIYNNDDSAQGLQNVGLSWIHPLLPFLDERQLYFDTRPAGGADSLRRRLNDGSDEALTNPAILSAHVGTLTCPSYEGKRFRFPVSTGSPPLAPACAITNYKAIASSTPAGLRMGPDAGDAPYPWTISIAPQDPKNWRHFPDGALIPGHALSIRQYSDGLSKTAFIAESIEENLGVWFMGRHCIVAALPDLKHPNVAPPQGAQFQRVNEMTPTSTDNFFAPNGYIAGTYDNPAIYGGLRAYINYDYRDDIIPATFEGGPYMDQADTMAYYDLPRDYVGLGTGGRALGDIYLRGLSSAHPEVNNHLFGDGAVRSIKKDVDVALYFFLVTRANDDPAAAYFANYGQN